MDGTQADVTERELEILRQLWEVGPCNRRRLTDALYPQGGPAHYTTVQKLLERLDAKGYVTSRMEAGVRVFTATVERESLIRLRLRQVAEQLCDGAVTPLITQLVDSNQLTPDEVAQLRALVRRLGKPRTE